MGALHVVDRHLVLKECDANFSACTSCWPARSLHYQKGWAINIFKYNIMMMLKELDVSNRSPVKPVIKGKKLWNVERTIESWSLSYKWETQNLLDRI